MLATLTSNSSIGFGSPNDKIMKHCNFCAPISNKTYYGVLDSPFNYTIITIIILNYINKIVFIYTRHIKRQS